MSSKEISTAMASWSLAAKVDKQDIAAAVPSIHSTHTSDADESELEEAAGIQAKESGSADKGNGRDQRKHGVMSLPAEIRETYAFGTTKPLLLELQITDLPTWLAASST